MIARKVDISNLTLFNTLKNIIYNLLQISYGKIKGYQKSRNKYLFDEISYLWRYRTDYKLYKKKSTFKLDKYKNKKFIFFPLLTEPEVALHGIADDFFFQLSAINLISRDLPADYILVVKEHLLALEEDQKIFISKLMI